MAVNLNARSNPELEAAEINSNKMASLKARDWRTKVRRNFLEGKVSFSRLDFHLPFPFPFPLSLLSFPLALNRLEDRDREARSGRMKF